MKSYFLIKGCFCWEKKAPAGGTAPGMGVFFIHNVFGHPVMEMLYLLGLDNFAKIVHDKTLPRKEKKV